MTLSDSKLFQRVQHSSLLIRVKVIAQDQQGQTAMLHAALHFALRSICWASDLKLMSWNSTFLNWVKDEHLNSRWREKCFKIVIKKKYVSDLSLPMLQLARACQTTTFSLIWMRNPRVLGHGGAFWSTVSNLPLKNIHTYIMTGLENIIIQISTV